ncbi:MAG: FKBP-type peptidyl-prolyl cis-trans isomerase [Oceanicaulis sp.]
MLRLRLTASAAVLALGLAACGSQSEDAQTGMEGEAAEAGQTSDAGQADAETTETAGEPMRAGPQPSEEIMQIVTQARACATDQGAMNFTAPDQGEGVDQASYNAEVSRSYLEQNAGRDCVFELPSGLQFTIVTAVEDAPSPNPGELVRVDYEGRLVSGDVFDSSYERGQAAVFPSDRLISGWVEALALMHVGEEWTLFIPPELGYGQRGTPGGPIGPNQALVFKIELLGLPGREQSGLAGQGG